MTSCDFASRKAALIAEIEELKSRMRDKEEELIQLLSNQVTICVNNGHGLTSKEIERYSRQIIVPQLGVKGQEKLKSGSVLIVGCGGLGCPSAQYLSGCGIGRIGLVDYDNVEINNLHRQLLHEEMNIGQSKVKSASNAIRRLNSGLKVVEYSTQLDSSNAMDIISQYDVVVDASDNVATRYLLNDACVLTGRPLVSGSAVQMEGQLTVYNYKGGPCYRCLFPVPPPPETVSNCGDVGVLGPVPGVIGVLEALQAVQILLESDGVLSSRLLVFEGADTAFKTIALRGRKEHCAVCGNSPTITELIDYEQFCGAPANDKGSGLKLLKPEERISAQDLSKLMEARAPHLLVDVRSPYEFEICSIPGSVNVPLASLSKEQGRAVLSKLMEEAKPDEGTLPVYLVCRRGNDSQIAVSKLKSIFPMASDQFKDLEGGLHSWANSIDIAFPVY